MRLERPSFLNSIGAPLMTITAFLLTLSSCGYDNTRLPADSPTRNGSGPGNPSTSSGIDFARIKSEVFEPHCLRCHSTAGGNRAGVNLETFASVKPIAASILSAVNSGFMPPAGPLPQGAKELLNSWVSSGAPEFATSESPSGTPGAPPSTPGGPTTPPSPNPGTDDDACREDRERMERSPMRIDIDDDFTFDPATGALERRRGHCPNDDR